MFRLLFERRIQLMYLVPLGMTAAASDLFLCPPLWAILIVCSTGVDFFSFLYTMLRLTGLGQISCCAQSCATLVWPWLPYTLCSSCVRVLMMFKWNERARRICTRGAQWDQIPNVHFHQANHWNARLNDNEELFVTNDVMMPAHCVLVHCALLRNFKHF